MSDSKVQTSEGLVVEADAILKYLEDSEFIETKVGSSDVSVSRIEREQHDDVAKAVVLYARGRDGVAKLNSFMEIASKIGLVK